MSVEQKVGRTFLDIKDVTVNSLISSLIEANSNQDLELNLDEIQIKKLSTVVKNSVEASFTNGFNAILRATK